VRSKRVASTWSRVLPHLHLLTFDQLRHRPSSSLDESSYSTRHALIQAASQYSGAADIVLMVSVTAIAIYITLPCFRMVPRFIGNATTWLGKGISARLLASYLGPTKPPRRARTTCSKASRRSVCLANAVCAKDVQKQEQHTPAAVQPLKAMMRNG
jgi:hypothetical protein